MKVPSTVSGPGSGLENVTFLSFPSKGLRIDEKNEAVPLVFMNRDAPVGAPPFGCVPPPGSQTSVFPTLQPQTQALQMPSTSLVFIELGLRWDPRFPPLSLPHFLDPVDQPKISGV